MVAFRMIVIVAQTAVQELRHDVQHQSRADQLLIKRVVLVGLILFL